MSELANTANEGLLSMATCDRPASTELLGAMSLERMVAKLPTVRRLGGRGVVRHPGQRHRPLDVEVGGQPAVSYFAPKKSM